MNCSVMTFYKLYKFVYNNTHVRELNPHTAPPPCSPRISPVTALITHNHQPYSTLRHINNWLDEEEQHDGSQPRQHAHQLQPESPDLQRLARPQQEDEEQEWGHSVVHSPQDWEPQPSVDHAQDKHLTQPQHQRVDADGKVEEGDHLFRHTFIFPALLRTCVVGCSYI